MAMCPKDDTMPAEFCADCRTDSHRSAGMDTTAPRVGSAVYEDWAMYPTELYLFTAQWGSRCPIDLADIEPGDFAWGHKRYTGSICLDCGNDINEPVKEYPLTPPMDDPCC